MPYKILNIRDIHKGVIGKHARPTQESMNRAWLAADKRNIPIGFDGRCYAPWKPNVKGMRYEKGHLVPRRA